MIIENTTNKLFLFLQLPSNGSRVQYDRHLECAEHTVACSLSIKRSQEPKTVAGEKGIYIY